MSAFRMFTFALFFALAASMDMEEEDWMIFDDAEDEAVSFMQSRAAMGSGPRKLLSEAAAGNLKANAATQPLPVTSGTFDGVAFSQTFLEVTAEKQEDVVPAWSDVLEEDDATCSLEGLTPGVCAMAALARAPVPRADGKEEQLDFVDPGRLERALFRELEAVLAGAHAGISTEQLSAVEKELSGFFAALPKNDAGLLAHSTVRYALHQRFLRQHSWYIRSLNPVGEAQTPASPGEALRGRVPEHLQELIEKREDGRGLGLRQLAALVATLEHLIQGDMGERVKAAYAAHEKVAGEDISQIDAMEVVLTYMAHFLSLEHKSGYAVTPEQARAERNTIEKGYSAWPNVVAMVGQAVTEGSQGGVLSFSQVVAAAKDVMGKFEVVSNQDCQDIKRELTDMPNGAEGSVALSDLHRKALTGGMLFAESTEYLATLGALEDDKKLGPSVLVPNYVTSPSNCLGTTSFFDMCCPNECEVVMQELENRLLKPTATPAEVSSILDSIRDEPLTDRALAELDAVAHGHGGGVPLHGYDFAFWLHRAFPTECPKPKREDYSGKNAEVEVPASEHEFQAVAALPFMVASRSDLAQELEIEEAVEEVREEVMHNSTNFTDVAAGGLAYEDLKAIAAQRLGAGLKLNPLRDGTSFAQAAVKVGSRAEDSEEDSRPPSSMV